MQRPQPLSGSDACSKFLYPKRDLPGEEPGSGGGEEDELSSGTPSERDGQYEEFSRIDAIITEEMRDLVLNGQPPPSTVSPNLQWSAPTLNGQPSPSTVSRHPQRSAPTLNGQPPPSTVSPHPQRSAPTLNGQPPPSTVSRHPQRSAVTLNGQL